MGKRNIHILTFLVVFSLVASVLTVPAQAFEIEPITWPNWNEAAAYPDPTGDANFPAEDITLCYVTHDDNYLYIRVEFVGLSIENAGTQMQQGRVLLDSDQNEMTGSNEAGDIGADYYIGYYREFVPASIESIPAEIYKWVSSGWEFQTDFYDYMLGDNYINLAVALGDVENEFWSFPIDIVFQLGLETDYNPNTGHVTYPPPRALPVGGEIAPITTLTLIPWIALIGVAAAITVAVLGYTLTRRKPLIH